MSLNFVCSVTTQTSKLQLDNCVTGWDRVFLFYCRPHFLRHDNLRWNSLNFSLPWFNIHHGATFPANQSQWIFISPALSSHQLDLNLQYVIWFIAWDHPSQPTYLPIDVTNAMPLSDEIETVARLLQKKSMFKWFLHGHKELVQRKICPKPKSFFFSSTHYMILRILFALIHLWFLQLGIMFIMKQLLLCHFFLPTGFLQSRGDAAWDSHWAPKILAEW